MEPPHAAPEGPEDQGHTVFDLPDDRRGGGETGSGESASLGASGIDEFEALDAEAERLTAPLAEPPTHRDPEPALLSVRGVSERTLPRARAFVLVGLGGFATILLLTLLFGSDPTTVSSAPEPAGVVAERPSRAAPEPERRRRAAAEGPAGGHGRGSARPTAARRPRSPAPTTLSPPGAVAPPAVEPAVPSSAPPAPPAAPGGGPAQSATRADAVREFDIP